MSATQAIFEEKWLKYASGVLAQESGCACDGDEIAWPGFIGRNYAQGRFLIVGSIHNAPVLKSSGIYDIVPAVKKWLSSRSKVADKQYLDMVRTAYIAAIPKWTDYVNANGKRVKGAVWNGIGKIVADLHLTYDDIAFTNLAKCGLPSGTTWSLEKARIVKHEQATPLMSLIDDLKPKYVLIVKERDGLTDIVSLEPRPGMVVRLCHNLNFTSGGVPRAEWFPGDAAAYAGLAP